MTSGKKSYHRQLADYFRKQRKRVARRERETYEERVRRDSVVTAQYGHEAHSSCGRKRRYETEADALSTALMSTRHGAPQLRAYHCEYCDGWHLTKVPLEEWEEE